MLVVKPASHTSSPLTSVHDDKIEKVKEKLFDNRRVGIKDIAEDLNTSHGSLQNNLVSVFGMKRVNARLAAKDLNLLQKR